MFFFFCRCGDLNRMSPHRKYHCISSTRKRQNHQTLEERLLSLKLILLYYFVIFLINFVLFILWGGGGRDFCFSFERFTHRCSHWLQGLARGLVKAPYPNIPSPNTATLSPLMCTKTITFSLPCRQLSLISLSIQQNCKSRQLCLKSTDLLGQIAFVSFSCKFCRISDVCTLPEASRMPWAHFQWPF